MKARVIDKAMFKEMPWANGMGVTTELFACKNTQSDRILWRISMAAVSRDGPFSHFAGYDRILVLTSGSGLRLSHQDGTEQVLSSAYQLATFPGDVATHATLLDGPVQDFNVIADRAAFKPAVTILSDGSHRVSLEADVLAVYAAENSLLITDPGMHRHPLPKGDLLLVDAPRQGKWSVSGATAIVTQFSKIQAGLNPLHCTLDAPGGGQGRTEPPTRGFPEAEFNNLSAPESTERNDSR